MTKMGDILDIFVLYCYAASAGLPIGYYICSQWPIAIVSFGCRKICDLMVVLAARNSHIYN